MSETFESEHVAHRLVIALDALPVPDEPSGLSAIAKPSLLRDPRMLLAGALLLVLVATLTSPQFEQAAAQLTRYIERIVVGPGAWVGYYHDHTAREANGRPATRLAFASGKQGGPTTPDIVGDNAYIGPWSPDGQQIAVSDGSQLYVGDQFGRLRPIAHVGLEYVVLPLGWNGNDKVWAMVSATPLAAPASLVTIDLATGALEYQSSDLPGGLVGPISPDGRWVRVSLGPPPDGTDRCGFITSLYDLVTRQMVDIVDADGRLAFLFGFLSDGRIVVGQCDRTARTLELYVGAPGTRPSLIAVVPIAVRRPVVAWGSGTDEIHVITSGPEAPQNTYVFDPSGRLLRTMRLPQLALAGELWAGISRDGKFMSVEGRALAGETSRIGVIDLATGHVTYLCERDCDYFGLR